MNAFYKKLSALINEDIADFIRKDSEQNFDQLIARSCLFAYYPKELVNKCENEGIFSPKVLLSKEPQMRSEIHEYNEKYMDSNLFADCIRTFMCRVPESLENCKEFLSKYTPIKINLDKLAKNDNIKFYTHSFPNNVPNKKIHPELIKKLIKKDKVLYKFFENSKNSNLNDVPNIAIYSNNGSIEPLYFKVLK